MLLAPTWCVIAAALTLVAFSSHGVPPRLCRLRVLHAASSARAARLRVRSPGQRAAGGREEDGETGAQGGPLLPADRGGVFLSRSPSGEGWSYI